MAIDLNTLRDREAWRQFGMDWTTPSDEAAKYFDAGVRQYVSWMENDQLGGLEHTCELMLRADPHFVMGKVLSYGLDLMATGRTTRLDADFKEAISNLPNNEESAPISNAEKQHVKAIQQFADGFLVDACVSWEEILRENPEDILALKFAHDAYFYLGNKAEIRDSLTRVMPSWKPHAPLYSHLKGMLSFGLEENGQFPEAEKEGKEALSLNKQDAWATHAVAHVLEMQTRYQEGIRFLSGTVKDWTPCGMLACHNYWHWAVYHVEKGDYEVALGIWDRDIGTRVTSGALLDIVDSTSLLYRLQLEGVEVGERWDPVYEICRPHLEDHILSFNDAHLLMSFLGLGDDPNVPEEHLESMKEFVRDGVGTNRDLCESFGIPLCEGMRAFHDGDFPETVTKLYPIKDQLFKIGGSNAQRDVFAQLLIHAAMKSPLPDHKKIANELLLERQALKPYSPLTERLSCRFRALQTQ